MSPEGGYTDAVMQRGACFPEIRAAMTMMRKLGIRLVPIDRTDRDEFYACTGYADRLAAYIELLQTHATQVTKTGSDPYGARVLSDGIGFLDSWDAVRNQLPPEVVNSSAYDKLAEFQWNLFLRTLPQTVLRHLPDDSSRGALQNEVRYFEDEWHTRTDAMVANIGGACIHYLGKRVVVFVGADHRYDIIPRLRARPEIELREYWDVSAK
jgi:hypothetical protein